MAPIMYAVAFVLIGVTVLTLYADIMGLIGGGLMCYFNLGITIPAFLRELQHAVNVSTLLVGLIKAPVLTGLPYGHVPTKVLLPVGAEVELAADGRDVFMVWGHRH